MNYDSDKKMKILKLLGLTIVGILILLGIMFCIKRVLDDVDDKRRSEQQKQLDEEFAEAELKREEERQKELERLSEEEAARAATEEVTEEDIYAHFKSTIATSTDAKMSYDYHDFKYTASTVELKPYTEVYEEKLHEMEVNGEEIILEETTDEEGNVVEPNLTIYNPLYLEPAADAALPCGTFEDDDFLKSGAVVSTNAILVDLDTDEIVVSRGCEEQLYPASMMKVLTAIAAADYLSDKRLDDLYVIKDAEIQKTIDERFSAVGTSPGDELPVRDLFYGFLVCSGADAGYALTHYIAGTEAELVDVMNYKAYQMGISDTSHFTNVIGAFDVDHYSTLKDIAVIMSTAIQNPLILDAMSTEIYTTVPTQKDPEGVTISNWFLRRIGTWETNGRVIAAKTGFISEAGFCAVSYFESYSGKHYICVTANSDGNWRTIFDHISLYRNYTK